MPMNPQIRAHADEFKALADHLLENKKSILEKWHNRIREKEPKATALEALSREDFYNSIPDFVYQLCKKLRDEDSHLEMVSQKHGSHRWQFGFHLRSLTVEWEDLHTVLMKQIDEAQNEGVISSGTLIEANKLLATYIHHSIQNSVDEYYKSERQKAEVHMRDLEAALREKEELTARRSEDLHQVTHDLGGSMAMLQLNLALMKQNPLDEETAENVDLLEKSAESLNELLTDLLRLFRLEADRDELTITEFDAAALLRDLCENLESLASKKNLELHSSGDETILVRSDRVKVQRIVQNLLLNSVKYTREGSVDVQWEMVSDQHWLLDIRDTGPGIHSTNAAPFVKTAGQEEPDPDAPAPDVDAENQPPEVQLHSEGIGLSIVRRLCDLLDAVVKIKTESGKGTHFQIIFPLELKTQNDAH